VDYAWTDAELGKLVDKPGSSGGLSLFTWWDGPATEAARIEELRKARFDYAGKRDALPRQPASKPALEAYFKRIQKIDEVFQQRWRDVAMRVAPGKEAPETGWKPGKAPNELTAGAHKLTAAEREQIRDVMEPPVGALTASGKPPDFEDTLAGETKSYGEKITARVNDWINSSKTELVDGKTEAERVDANLNPWSRYEEIAAAAKDETDKVFGAYRRGPPFKHGSGKHLGNLRDRWEEEQAKQAKQTPRQRRAQAEEHVRYILQSDGGVRLINKAHHARVSRTKEARILADVVKKVAAAREADLQAIDRGWEGVASGGVVWLQRWKQGSTEERRFHWWDMFQTMIHEYLHTLTHAKYYALAATLPGGGGGDAYNTFVEGMTSALTEIVWSNLGDYLPWRSDLAKRVEGTDYVDWATTEKAVPPVFNRRYGSYEQAMGILHAIGPENVFAAYFLGEVDYIRPAKPKP
jgi:Spy/CpxP family protein refolding chaperone